MIKLKVGGVILTGLAAWILVNKAINTIDNSVNKMCESSKWKSYYKCWSKGKIDGDPIPPGYSRTSPVTSEVDENAVTQDSNEAAAKAAVDLIKEGLSKLKVTITKPSDKQEEASEGQETASENDISDTLKDFDTKSYQLPEDEPPVDIDHGFDKHSEISRISSLIIDMTGNATKEEMARAVKHSMVIIDADKYHLDWKKSYFDNNIDELIEKYQPWINDTANDVLDYMEKKYEKVADVEENKNETVD